MATGADDTVLRALPPELLLGEIGPADPLRDIRGAPVVAPRNIDELSTVMARSSRHGWRVRAVGHATSLPPGFLDQVFDLVVTTRSLDAIHHYEPADLTLTADAGVTLASIGCITREAGQWLPLDPAKRGTRSLGGVLASGGFGPLHAGFGSPRDHVLGVTLVTGDGRVLELGGQVVKNVAGYDLVKLAVGSRGRLGILASATLRLHPMPARDVTLLFDREGIPDAVALARALATAPVQIAALELMAPTVGPEGWVRGKGAGSHGAVTVAARILGSAESVQESERILVAVVGHGADHRLEDTASTDWFTALEGLEDDALAVVRLGHDPSRLAELIEATDGECDVAAHVAAGIVRVAFLDRRTAGDAGVAQALVRLRDRVTAIGGSFRVTRSNGISWPTPEPPTAPAVRELIEGIVTSFDPAGVLSDRS